MAVFPLLLATTIVACLTGVVVVVQANIACDDDATCVEKLRSEGSSCWSNGICSNPFSGGCLRNKLPKNSDSRRHAAAYGATLRTCNSADDDESDIGVICERSEFDYPEIRISSQDWTTAIFTAWVLQIFLSEILNVPATIESSAPDKNANFYDAFNSMDYGAKSYDYDALQNAVTASAVMHQDCRAFQAASSSSTDEYRPCAHVIPEVWSGQYDNWRAAEAAGIVEPPTGSGVVGKLGWFIPLYTARNDSTLLEFLGYIGPENRPKIANAFWRPTTWKDYCVDESADQCATDDGVAARPPETISEQESYFATDLFTGFFRATDENDCVKNPNTCTGHLTDTPCEWSTFATAQAYWNDISVVSNGPLPPNGGYKYAQMLQIYRAAVATKSNVLMYFWFPEDLYQEFLGTDAEMMTVQ